MAIDVNRMVSKIPNSDQKFHHVEMTTRRNNPYEEVYSNKSYKKIIFA